MAYRYLTLAVIAAMLAGCSEDHREEISLALLYPDGKLDEAAFSGALLEKFPRGTSPRALETFVQSLHGSCFTQPGHLYCSIPQASTFCMVSRVVVNATLHQGMIGDIKTERGNSSC